MSHMFEGARSFNGDLSQWDVSQVRGVEEGIFGERSKGGCGVCVLKNILTRPDILYLDNHFTPKPLFSSYPLPTHVPPTSYRCSKPRPRPNVFSHTFDSNTLLHTNIPLMFRYCIARIALLRLASTFPTSAPRIQPVKPPLHV